jgi:hypothetical protein
MIIPSSSHQKLSIKSYGRDLLCKVEIWKKWGKLTGKQDREKEANNDSCPGRIVELNRVRLRSVTHEADWKHDLFLTEREWRPNMSLFL